MIVDLHCHSTASDGVLAPTKLVERAHGRGVQLLALTDHDTTSGWAEAAEAATSLGMTFLPGMELSARHEWRSVHVLAYLFDPDEPALSIRVAHREATAVPFSSCVFPSSHHMPMLMSA